ncbi:MAG TPA: DUF6799 domain-containing protein [Puia sp.]|jgi:hypothetical protein
MKKLTLFVAIFMSSTVLFAKDVPGSDSRIPKVYVMMKEGKLIEINNGRQKKVRKDMTLVNATTIHPNGSIDSGSGQHLQLKEDEYMTMDGKIHKLKNMARHHHSKK